MYKAGYGLLADGPDSLSILSDRINHMRDSPNPNGSSSSSNAATLDPDQPGNVLWGPSSNSSSSIDGIDAAKSFSDADDDELSAALGKRISQIATTTGSWSDSMEEDMRQPLTGEVSRGLGG